MEFVFMVSPIKQINDTVGPSLAAHFAKQKDGHVRAEVCKGVAIYKNGGYYADPDLNFRIPVG